MWICACQSPQCNTKPRSGWKWSNWFFDFDWLFIKLPFLVFLWSIRIISNVGRSARMRLVPLIFFRSLASCHLPFTPGFLIFRQAFDPIVRVLIIFSPFVFPSDYPILDLQLQWDLLKHSQHGRSWAHRHWQHLFQPAPPIPKRPAAVQAAHLTKSPSLSRQSAPKLQTSELWSAVVRLQHALFFSGQGHRVSKAHHWSQFSNPHGSVDCLSQLRVETVILTLFVRSKCRRLKVLVITLKRQAFRSYFVRRIFFSSFSKILFFVDNVISEMFLYSLRFAKIVNPVLFQTQWLFHSEIRAAALIISVAIRFGQWLPFRLLGHTSEFVDLQIWNGDNVERLRLRHRAPTRYVDINILTLLMNLYRRNRTRTEAVMLTSMPFCRLCLTSWERPGECNSSLARARKGFRGQPETNFDPIFLTIAMNLVMSREGSPSHDAPYLSTTIGTHSSHDGIGMSMYLLYKSLITYRTALKKKEMDEYDDECFRRLTF